MDHLIIVKHENDLIKHLMEPRERETRGTLGRRHWDNIKKAEREQFFHVLDVTESNEDEVKF